MQVDLNHILSLPYPEQRKWMRCFRFRGERAINIHDFRQKLKDAIKDGIETVTFGGPQPTPETRHEAEQRHD